jgi:hypothetical protein
LAHLCIPPSCVVPSIAWCLWRTVFKPFCPEGYVA